jgi:integrase
MKAESTVKTWAKTRLANLVRHRSGRYYARAYAGGKEVWKSLKTSHFSVAEAKLAEFLKQHRETRAITRDETSAKMTFKAAAKLHVARLEEKGKIKPRTMVYWKEVLAALRKSWPELDETELRKITETRCRQWAASYRKTASPSRFNNTLAIFRHVLREGMKAGVIYLDPSRDIERAAITAKKLTLPNLAQFRAFLDAMRTAGGRDSKNCADFAAGLAFTGCRTGEAAKIEWRDIDFENRRLTVRGDPITGTKNWKIRHVPLIPEAVTLFKRMQEERAEEAATDKVFLVRECQKSIDRAAKLVGMERITHHDLRHLFATIAIESGVDIPTVSRWLGHQDGGALAMKTYGHLRDEHSQLQAQKVSFAQTPVAPVSAS